MKILFFGDSITDARRARESDFNERFGAGFVMQIAGELFLEDPVKYEILNRGISGERIVDLYARIKKDVWNENPDVLTILEGINDISHEVWAQNGVETERWARIYKMLLEETIARLPNTKIIIGEPFVFPGEISNKDFPEYAKIRERAQALKKLTEDMRLYYLPLQAVLDEKAERFGVEVITKDGLHPTVYASKVIAEEWLKLFREKIS